MQTRKQSSYIFYGQTTSLCEDCYDLIPAKIVIEDNDVFFQKRCKIHGTQKTKVSSDANYYRWAKSFIKPGDRPHQYQTKTEYGCPLDCGLCPDHEQHSCVALIEINEACNLSCPVCFADSSPKKLKTRSLEDIEMMMDTLVQSEGEADVLQISGGEPTIHPQILDVLSLAKTKPINHLMLNTNGVRLAKDYEFVKSLKQFCPGFEVYLQFDSLKKEALTHLRGVDLRSVRQHALKNLESNNIPVTLVITVKKGINDQEVGDIIAEALTYSCVRGVTFQPIQDSGRNENFDKNTDRSLLTDIRKALYEQVPALQPDDIIPLPCNPESIAIAYCLRNGNTITPITSSIPKQDLISEIPNAISFEKNIPLKQRVGDLFSLSSGDLNAVSRMSSLLCCLPEVPTPENLGYEHIFRIAIVEFLDRYNFCVGNVKRSCLHFVTDQQQIIPFDTYNLFYRNGLVHQLRKKVHEK